LPPLRLHLLDVTNLRPIDILLAFSNQGNGTFNAYLQALLPKTQPKIFFENEVLGQRSKGVGLFFLREEVREQPRKC
jgi:hypothetical protein